ncbi:MAG: carbamoyltransferase HypF [Gammaproteobacteria bacterium]
MVAVVPDPVSRRHLRVAGQVQGVGFRPFVYRLAGELNLDGWVRNSAAGVEIEVQGDREALTQFEQRLRAECPPLARVDECQGETVPTVAGRSGFTILHSQAGAVRTGITPDAATCPECLQELFDPEDRRYRYPFLNCTHCGPRYTITAGLPYDRPNTSMAAFEQCPECRAEYETPSDRRFHVQPNACPECGPQLALLNAAGEEINGRDVVAEALRRIRAGEILAVKGLGGFHLVCDARNGPAVARLRERKQREEKPLAVMVAGVESLRELACIQPEEQALLQSPERPIVLLRKCETADRALAGIAPGIAWLGVMLPYTPLHYLLFHEAAGRPAGTQWLEDPQPLVLVMTSANPGGEPLVIDNREAQRRLAGIADAFLQHDRDILIRCDDSVVRHNGRHPAFIRRARGYTPQSVPLAKPGARVLALGAWFKNTFCVTRENEAFVSQHIGDLDNVATCEALEQAVEHLVRVLEIAPEAVAHDLHPDFFSTRLAVRLAQEWEVPAIAVQHHHAHAAAVVAEHGLTGPVLALTLDGVGLGSDGSAWGGELLRVEGADFQRLGHLRPLPLPGGDRAAREPWRMAAGVLHLLGRGGEIPDRFRQESAKPLMQILERGVNTPLTSSAGRWFDAAAGLLGVRELSSYEGQAAMLLEGCAARYGEAAANPQAFAIDEEGVLDLLPLLAELADETEAGRGAARFHATLSMALGEWAIRAARSQGIEQIVLSGGCMMNHLLSNDLVRRLRNAKLRVHEAGALPPNDGGISLGQAWVARKAIDGR